MLSFMFPFFDGPLSTISHQEFQSTSIAVNAQLPNDPVDRPADVWALH